MIRPTRKHHVPKPGQPTPTAPPAPVKPPNVPPGAVATASAPRGKQPQATVKLLCGHTRTIKQIEATNCGKCYKKHMEAKRERNKDNKTEGRGQTPWRFPGRVEFQEMAWDGENWSAWVVFTWDSTTRYPIQARSYTKLGEAAKQCWMELAQKEVPPVVETGGTS